VPTDALLSLLMEEAGEATMDDDAIVDDHDDMTGFEGIWNCNI
jgi:hypothetical protein